MGSVMFLTPQGKDSSKLLQKLEERITILESVVKALQSNNKPHGGRPKDKHGQRVTQVNN